MRCVNWKTVIARLTVLASCLLVFPTCGAAGSVGSIVESLARSGRKAGPIAAKANLFKHVDDLPVPKIATKREAELIKRFDRLDNIDDGLRKQFRDLPIGQKSLVIELGEASQRVLRNHPDPEDLLRKLDGDGLLQARTYGDFVVDGVQLVGPGYKDVVRKTGPGASSFYSKYLRPYYKQLAAAGLVTAYLAAPEQFHDAAGALTERGARELTRLGIELASAVPRGLWEGFRSKLSESPISSGVGIFVIVCCLVLALPRVRWHLWQSIEFWVKTPGEPPQGTQGNASHRIPFKE